jgi:hypothetical protein
VPMNWLGTIKSCIAEQACLQGEGGQTPAHSARGVACHLAATTFTARGKPVGVRRAAPRELAPCGAHGPQRNRVAAHLECFDLSKLSLSLCVKPSYRSHLTPVAQPQYKPKRPRITARRGLPGAAHFGSVLYVWPARYAIRVSPHPQPLSPETSSPFF